MEILYTKINNTPYKLYKAERPGGTVVAVHGFGGSKESFAIETLAQRVCSKGLNVLTFDLPAHGERTEGAEGLQASLCIKELMAAEDYAKSLGSEMYAFATSFGGMCMLHRLERYPDSFKRIVLRVPAVDMDESLLRVAHMCSADFSLEKAKTEGFNITLGREYNIPYRFYEELQQLRCVRHSDVWDNGRIMTVYAQNDELVSPRATEGFLSSNPKMRSLCIKGSGHRMAEPQQLDEAIGAAAEFLLG